LKQEKASTKGTWFASMRAFSHTHRNVECSIEIGLLTLLA